MNCTFLRAIKRQGNSTNIDYLAMGVLKLRALTREACECAGDASSELATLPLMTSLYGGGASVIVRACVARAELRLTRAAVVAMRFQEHSSRGHGLW